MNTRSATLPTCLHLVMSNTRQGLEDCLAQCGSDDSILLLAGGVEHIALINNYSLEGLKKVSGKASVYALQADIAARALQDNAALIKIKLVDEEVWVDLIKAHLHTLTWC